jgi:hypothetical protein
MNHLKRHPEVLALIAGGSAMILAPALHEALIMAFLDALGFSSGGIAAGQSLRIILKVWQRTKVRRLNCGIYPEPHWGH